MADKPYVLQALQNIETNMEENKNEIIEKVKGVSDKLGLYGNTDVVSVFGKLNQILSTMGVDITSSDDGENDNIYKMIQQIISKIGSPTDTRYKSLSELVDRIFARTWKIDIDDTISYKPIGEDYEKDKTFPTSDEYDDELYNTNITSIYNLLAYISENQLGLSGIGKEKLSWCISYLKDHLSDVEKSVITDESNRVTDSNAPKPLWQLVDDGITNITNKVNSVNNTLTDTSSSTSIINNIKGSSGAPLLNKVLLKTYDDKSDNDSIQTLTIYGPGVFSLTIFATDHGPYYADLVDITLDGIDIHIIGFDSNYIKDNAYIFNYLKASTNPKLLTADGKFVGYEEYINSSSVGTLLHFSNTLKITIHSKSQQKLKNTYGGLISNTSVFNENLNSIGVELAYKSYSTGTKIEGNYIKMPVYGDKRGFAYFNNVGIRASLDNRYSITQAKE